MGARWFLALLLSGSLSVPNAQSADVSSLLERGHFADALARAVHSGDTADLGEVWFRAGLFERVLELGPESIEGASNRLVFAHRQAAAALRVGSNDVTRARIDVLTSELEQATSLSPSERAAWQSEVASFRDAWTQQVELEALVEKSEGRARLTSLALVLTALGLGVGAAVRG